MAYHRGTVWMCLIGPYLDAHYAVYNDKGRVLEILEDMLGHMMEGDIGSLAEIFNADEPHEHRGCPAQAWSVAEVIRIYDSLCNR